LPSRSLMRILSFGSSVQLSDCVIAIKAPHAVLEHAAAAINQRWASFCGIYAGTGAKFVTVARLGSWLSLQNL
jgi:hypothetical protein